jgi:hypothetical protein
VSEVAVYKRRGPLVTVELNSDGEGEVPTKIRLFKAGLNEYTNGQNTYDPEDAPLLKSDDTRDLKPIDVDHMSHDPMSSPDGHVAVGWFTADYREDGVFATDIQWSARAVQWLKERAFRFISPAFWADGDGKLVGLIDFALTNNPATLNPIPLVKSTLAQVRAREESESSLMAKNSKSDEAKVEETKPAEVAEPTKSVELKATDSSDAKSKENEKADAPAPNLPDGITPDSTPEEMLAAIEALMNQVADLQAQLADDQKQDDAGTEPEAQTKSRIIDALAKDAFVAPAQLKRLESYTLLELTAFDKVTRSVKKPLVSKSAAKIVVTKSDDDNSLEARAEKYKDHIVFKQFGRKPKTATK